MTRNHKHQDRTKISRLHELGGLGNDYQRFSGLIPQPWLYNSSGSAFGQQEETVSCGMLRPGLRSKCTYTPILAVPAFWKASLHSCTSPQVSLRSRDTDRPGPRPLVIRNGAGQSRRYPMRSAPWNFPVALGCPYWKAHGRSEGTVHVLLW